MVDQCLHPVPLLQMFSPAPPRRSVVGLGSGSLSVVSRAREESPTSVSSKTRARFERTSPFTAGNARGRSPGLLLDNRDWALGCVVCLPARCETGAAYPLLPLRANVATHVRTSLHTQVPVSRQFVSTCPVIYPHCCVPGYTSTWVPGLPLLGRAFPPDGGDSIHRDGSLALLLYWRVSHVALWGPQVEIHSGFPPLAFDFVPHEFRRS
jgi:hypothetical protein